MPGPVSIRTFSNSPTSPRAHVACRVIQNCSPVRNSVSRCRELSATATYPFQSALATSPQESLATSSSGAQTTAHRYPERSRVKPVPYKYAKVVLPNGEGSFITSEMPPCVPVSLSIGVVPPEPALPPPGSLAALDVTIDSPARIRAGHVLHYTVVLSNPRQVYGPSGEEANRTVSFAPCPGYTESLDLYRPGHVGQVHTWTYKLNCGPVGRLAPGKSARFAMELPVPTVSKALPAAVGWNVNTNNGNIFNAAAMSQNVKVYP